MIKSLNMLKIRLKPTGRKKNILYRIVVMEEGRKRDGKVTDTLGWLNKQKKPISMKLDEEKMKSWIKKGAQITDGVRKILKK